MADMAEMEMELPDNTAPMMTGRGPFGSVEMGGMFSTLKVRKTQRPGDYSDPGWYQHPIGTVAGPVGQAEAPPAASAPGSGSKAIPSGPQPAVEVRIQKPGNHKH